MMQFKVGAETLYTGAVDVLDLMSDCIPRSQPEVSKALHRADGSTDKTLKRMVAMRMLSTERRNSPLPHVQAVHGGVTYYAITQTGLDALRECRAQGYAADEDEDAQELAWPKYDYDAIVAQAVRTQPTSVFGLGRFVEPPRKMVRSVFEMI